MEKPLIAKFHRMSIGTITSDASMSVKFMRGGFLGTIEESFIARLRPGDGFSFAGLQLELIRVRDMAAIVRKSKKSARRIPQWMGGKMPLSTQLAHSVRLLLKDAKNGQFHGPEMKAVEPVLKIQAAWSAIPDVNELLIEWTKTRFGFHYFIYPFAGRLVHEGLAPLAAYRISKLAPRSFTLTMNDYGFALNTTTALQMEEKDWRAILSPERLTEDLWECLNSTGIGETTIPRNRPDCGPDFSRLSRRAGKSNRQLQASSGLFYEVFTKYDPENRLLAQARREVIDRQLEVRRLRATLEKIHDMKFIQPNTARLTPLAFPLWSMWVQAEVSSEQWRDRVQRMAEQLEAAAAEP